NLNYPVNITNANGNIFGGGGGGGASTYFDYVNTLACGGGGGGGQGYGTSAGGLKNSCYSGATYPSGTAGSPGNQTSPGNGSVGASRTSSGTTICEAAAPGATWGQNGAQGGRCYHTSGG